MVKFFLLLLCFLPATFAVASQSSVKEVRMSKNEEDPNGVDTDLLTIDRTLLKQLMSKVDLEKNNARLWRVDLNGRQKFIFLQSPINKPDGSYDTRMLDKIGPAFDVVNGKIVEAKIPSFPCEYTNILLPFMEIKGDGIKLNVHYSIAFTADGKSAGIGNDAISAMNAVPASHRCTLLWTGDTLSKIHESFICDEKACSKKQIETIKNLIPQK